MCAPSIQADFPRLFVIRRTAGADLIGEGGLDAERHDVWRAIGERYGGGQNDNGCGWAQIAGVGCRHVISVILVRTTRDGDGGDRGRRTRGVVAE